MPPVRPDDLHLAVGEKYEFHPAKEPKMELTGSVVEVAKLNDGHTVSAHFVRFKVNGTWIPKKDLARFDRMTPHVINRNYLYPLSEEAQAQL